MPLPAGRAAARRSASAPAGRAPRSARRAPRPSASGSSPGRWRCAGAGRRRTRADSGCATPGSSSHLGERLRGAVVSLARAIGRRLVDEQSFGDDLALPSCAAKASRRDPAGRSAGRAAAAASPPSRARRCRARQTGCGPLEGTRRSSARASVDLPEPDSPTMPMVSPCAQSEADAIDRREHQTAARRSRPRARTRRATSRPSSTHVRIRAAAAPCVPSGSAAMQRLRIGMLRRGEHRGGGAPPRRPRRRFMT